MTLGSGNIFINPKSSGSGGGITAANNGLSLANTTAVLGQEIGELGDPAILLQDREIPCGGFTLFMDQGTDNPPVFHAKTNYAGTWQGMVIENSSNNAAGKSVLQITSNFAADVNLKLGIDSSTAAVPYRRFIDSRNGILWIGDTENTTNGSKLIINDGGSNIAEIQRAAGTTLFRVSSAGRVGATDYFDIIGTDVANGNVLGDGYNTLQSSQANGIKFRDNAGNVPFTFAFGGGTPVATINAAVVINDAGADKDVRIEGDTDANLFFTDASTDRVGIGTNTPTAKLHISGDIKTATVNGSAGAWKLGVYQTGAVTADTANYLDVEVDGVAYKLIVAVAL